MVEPIVAGHFGSSSRFTLRYEEDDDSLPGSLFLKMATEHQSARDSASADPTRARRVRLASVCRNV